MGDISDNYRVKADEGLEDDKVNTDDISKYLNTGGLQSDSAEKEPAGTDESLDDYKQTLQSLIDAEVKNAIEEELKKAKQELITEQRKAIVQIIEENKAIIKELVGKEKIAIQEKAEELRKSLLAHLSEELGGSGT